MTQLDAKLEIASRLLSAIISQDRNRQLSDRIHDIEHSLEVAAELIRRAQDDSPPNIEHTLRPQPAVRTRERLVDAGTPPFAQRLRTLRSDAPRSPSRPPKLH